MGYLGFICTYLTELRIDFMAEYNVTKNKLKTDIEPIVLSQNKTTRVIVKSEKFPDSGLRLEFIHQKKNAQQRWEDEPKFNKRNLQANEYVSFQLDTGQTQKLLEALPQLSAIANTEINPGKSRVAVVDPSKNLVIEGKEKETFELLLRNHPQEMLNYLAELKPEQLSHIALNYKHQKYQQALELFENRLSSNDWQEQDWENFFDTNKWIFGHGLDYRIMGVARRQPTYGGANYTGTGTQKGDFLMHTEANIKFTVLVEMKTPQANLLQSEGYRNGVYQLGKDVIGGITQLQVNCRTWDRSAKTEENEELLERDIYTCSPKGILIIGNTKQLDSSNSKEKREKRTSFELFRQNLKNPDIITFDELYERAKFIVELYKSETPT
ncbi:MAG: Shedu immune nuclease family protein [Vampirovibrionales bacterium]